jgi:transcriptional regulator with XRE-family HTH domain
VEDQVKKWGKRIRAFRKLKGYTQEELAKALHVSVTVIGAIERGKKVPSPFLFEEISQLLEVSLQELKAERSESL